MTALLSARTPDFNILVETRNMLSSSINFFKLIQINIFVYVTTNVCASIKAAVFLCSFGYDLSGDSLLSYIIFKKVLKNTSQ